MTEKRLPCSLSRWLLAAMLTMYCPSALFASKEGSSKVMLKVKFGPTDTDSVNFT
jgi:hypothetical protein